MQHWLKTIRRKWRNENGIRQEIHCKWSISESIAWEVQSFCKAITPIGYLNQCWKSLMITIRVGIQMKRLLITTFFSCWMLTFTRWFVTTHEQEVPSTYLLTNLIYEQSTLFDRLNRPSGIYFVNTYTCHTQWEHKHNCLLLAVLIPKITPINIIILLEEHLTE